MKIRIVKSSLLALLGAMFMTPTVQAGHQYSGAYFYGPAGFYTPPVYYQAPVYRVYQPVLVPTVVYRPAIVVARPVATFVAPPIPVRSVVHPVPVHTYAPPVPVYTRTSYDPYGRYARYKQKTYTPYGTEKTEYRFDKKYGTWRVKYDFDD